MTAYPSNRRVPLLLSLVAGVRHKYLCNWNVVSSPCILILMETREPDIVDDSCEEDPYLTQ
jgi:hypothetical protein